MKTRLKKVAFVCLAICALFFLTLVVERLRGTIPLNRLLDRLDKSGELRPVSKLAPSPCASTANGSLYLQSFSNQYNSLTTLVAMLPVAMELQTNGRAKTAWEKSSWTNKEQELVSWSMLQEELRTAAPLVTALGKSLQMPCFLSGYRYDRGFLDSNFPNFSFYRTINQLLTAQCISSLRSNSPDFALHSLKLSLELINRQRADGLVITELIRMAGAGDTLSLTWDFLQHNQLQSPQLEEIQRLWEKQQFLEPLIQACHLEQSMTRDQFQLLKASHANRLVVLEMENKLREVLDSEPERGRGRLTEWVYSHVWNFAWSDQEHLMAQKCWAAYISVLNFSRSNAWLEVKSKYETSPILQDPRWVEFNFTKDHLNWYDRLRLLGVSTWGLSERMVFLALRLETDRNLALSAIALKRYYLEKGEFPLELANLVPRYLKTIPQDRMNLKPLRYERHQKQFLLYSVGKNGTDDLGNASVVKGEAERGYWRGLDAVWPLKAND